MRIRKGGKLIANKIWRTAQALRTLSGRTHLGQKKEQPVKPLLFFDLQLP
ncbi:MAG: hypothetical protein ACJARL_000400 [Halopseudomonas sp.]|jgi:hypothetical protein